jgi:hypothetical protein
MIISFKMITEQALLKELEIVETEILGLTAIIE